MEKRTKRNLTEREEQVIRLVHHEFAGLDKKTAAVKMGITVSEIYSLLQKVRIKAPQLFPILTAEQFTVHKLITQGNLSYGEVAERLGCDITRVRNVVQRLHEKGFRAERPKTIRYDESMDNNIKEVF